MRGESGVLEYALLLIRLSRCLSYYLKGSRDSLLGTRANSLLASDCFIFDDRLF